MTYPDVNLRTNRITNKTKEQKTSVRLTTPENLCREDANYFLLKSNMY
jgi:hypothetical protein